MAKPCANSQLVFAFMLPPEKHYPEILEVPELIQIPKCRLIDCDRPAAKGKAYCSKSHSPFGRLKDEPDNAPIEWTPPEGFYKCNPAKIFF